MDERPDLSILASAEKNAPIVALWAQVRALATRVAELEAKLGSPPTTPDNSSLPPSSGKKRGLGIAPPWWTVRGLGW